MYYQLINFGDEEFYAYPNKSLYWKRLNTLIISDLHIGKENRTGVSKDPLRSGHFGFGLGKHFCIGYELARKEAVMGSEMLVEKLGNPALGEGQTGPVVQGNSFFAVKELSVSFTH